MKIFYSHLLATMLTANFHTAIAQSTSFADVPCDIVTAANKAKCEQDHKKAGIGEDETAAPATRINAKETPDIFDVLPQTGDPITDLYGCTSPGQIVLLPSEANVAFAGNVSSLEHIAKVTKSMATCSDERIKPAAEAAMTPEIKEAVKTMYVKQKALISALLPDRNQSRIMYHASVQNAQRDYDDARERLSLERKLLSDGSAEPLPDQ